MTDDLARRAVACARWRWLPGMVAGCGGRRVRSKRTGGPPYRGALPDLSDAATVGALLALVREAYGDQTASPQHRSGSWVLSGVDPAVPLVTARTEARCLVLALEHAP